ncbi:uncharacterized protein [Panulirus ornatus]|uniref:uncharacterized protein n=1 Tax=Panulirus ornatus TaxID=150431 RepID=UPI003A86BA56
MMGRPGISVRQQRGLWYYQGLSICGREILQLIFHKTKLCQNSIKEHIFRLLEEDHKGESQKPLTDAKKERLYKKQFYEYQRQILDGQTPLEDITLLYTLLRNRRICDLANNDSVWTDESQQLEYGIHFFKAERDKLSHESLELSEQEFSERMVYMMHLVRAMLLEAGRRFKDDFSQLSSTICHKIENIQDTNIISNLDPSNTEHWQKLKNIEKLRREHEERDALDRIVREITNTYEDLCQVQPAPWLLRDGHQAKPHEVFVSMELQQDNEMQSLSRKRVIITHDQLVTVRRPDGTKPTLVIVQGEGGAGKSTLMKLVMYHWLEKTHEIKGLSSVPLILYTECRDANTESLEDLLRNYCPSSTALYGSDRLKEIVMSQSLIIIVDGYDEINPSSKLLLNEILAYNGDHIRVFVTTRPMNARELVTIVSETKIKIILQVLGIDKDHQPEFVTKLLQVLLDSNQNVQEEAEKLMDYVRGMTDEVRSLLHNPLNLSLTVLLWVESPEKMNAFTSMTALFTTFRELTTGKVIERLIKRGVTISEAKGICQQFLQYFDELAYETHCRGEFQLKTDTIRKLWGKLLSLKLPDEAEEDLLSTFFTTKLSKEQLRLTRTHSFRHRLEQQYSCASHLATVVTQPVPHVTLTQLITQEYERRSNLESEFKEVLIFLTGILYTKNVLPAFATEIIDLVHLETRYDYTVTVEVLLHHLSECKTDVTVLQAVQERLDHCHKEGRHTWQISTGRHLCSLPPLLTSTSVEVLELDIPETPASLTHLHPVLEDVVQKGIKVQLSLLYNSGESEEKDDRVLAIFSNSELLITFEGNVSETGVLLLPESLQELCLDVSDHFIPHLNRRLPSLHNLYVLKLNVVSLVHLLDPDTHTRLQYPGEELALVMECPYLVDDHARSVGAWLGSMWPAEPKAHCMVTIWDTDLTATGIEMLLRSFVATLPADLTNQAGPSSSQGPASSKDLGNLVASRPDDLTDQAGPSFSQGPASSKDLGNLVASRPDDLTDQAGPSSSQDPASSKDLGNLVATLPADLTNQAGPSSSQDPASSKDLGNLVASRPDDLTDQAGPSSSRILLPARTWGILWPHVLTV